MSTYESTKFLEKLGLTEYEARTLSTLFKLKEAEAPEISRSAQVPKTRVYDVLDKLIKKELLIEISGRPKLYRSISPKKAIDSLVTSKKEQLAILEKEATKIKDAILDFSGDESGEKVMKVKDKQDFEKILAQELSKATKSVQGLTEIHDTHKIIHEGLAKLKERNIQIKLLNSMDSKKLMELHDEKGFHVKKVDHGLNAFIIDGKKVVLAISDFKQQKPEYSFVILNNHKPMADAFTHYFDKHWN